MKWKADGEKALEELEKPGLEAEHDRRGHCRARVGLAADSLGMLYKNDLVIKEE